MQEEIIQKSEKSEEEKFEKVIENFSAWIRTCQDMPAEGDFPEDLLPSIDLFTLFGEIKGLREDVKKDLKRNVDIRDELIKGVDELRRQFININEHITNDKTPAFMNACLSGLTEIISRLEAVETEKKIREDDFVMKLERFIEPIFDISDRTERAIGLLENIINKKNIFLRMLGVYKELEGYLESQKILLRKYLNNLMQIGIEPVGIKGETFDPAIMKAVDIIIDENQKDGTVAEVIMRGFIHGAKSLRPAEVIVSRKK